MSKEVSEAQLREAIASIEANFEGHLRAAGTCVNVALGQVAMHPKVNKRVLQEAATLFTAGFKCVASIYDSEIVRATPADKVAMKVRESKLRLLE